MPPRRVVVARADDRLRAEMGPRQSTASFASTFASTLADLARAREQFAAWLAEQGVPDEQRMDLEVAFSELGSNAVTAVGDDHREVEVTAWRVGPDVVFEVTNPVVRSAEPLSRWDLDDPLRGGGRGLMIVRALTDAIDVRYDDGDLTVRCRANVATD